MSHQEAALVVGATGGIGQLVCIRLAERGARVLAAGRSDEQLSKLSSHSHITPLRIEDFSFGEMERTLNYAREHIGPLTGVVNCLGSLLLKPAHLTTEEEWKSVIDINLHSSFAVLKYSIEHLRETKGSLVLTSSAAARIGLANHEAIAAAKAGIEGLAISAAATYASKGVRINVVSPGLTETPLTSNITEKEASRNFSLGMHPLGRLGQPEDIASAICWFLSPENDWVTAQVLAVDGGLSTLKT